MQRNSGQSKLAAGPQLSSSSGLSSCSPHTADVLLPMMWGGKEQSLRFLSVFGKGTLGANMWELLPPDTSVLLVDNPTVCSTHSLDQLLDSGLYTGEVTELMGAPGSGKTQVSGTEA